MDAFEIGYALAFPVALLAGLEVLDEEFGLLDAAAAAAGDDPVLAAAAFAELGLGAAPADLPEVNGGDGGEDEAGGAETELPLGARVSGAARIAGAALVRAAAQVWPRRAGAERAGGRAPGMTGEPERAGGGPGAAPIMGASQGGSGQAAGAGRAGSQGRAAFEAARARRRGGGIWGREGRAAADAGGGGGEAPIVSQRGLGASGRSAASAYQRGVQERVLAGETAVPGPGAEGGAGLPMTARVAAAERSVSPRGGRATEEVEAARRVSGPVAGWGEESTAPGAGGGRPGQTPGMRINSLFPDRSAAPDTEGGGGGHDGGDRPVVLDGRVVGQWLSERMARDAARPGAGPSFFDPRQAPAWVPSGVM